tara:strand:- start:768 stop:1940 length:1173 start_codon:yes stop_codon:yes gene_type:complete
MEEALLRALEHSLVRLVCGDCDHFFELVHVLPCVSKAFYAAAKADPRLPFMIAYYTASMNPPATYFFGGVPRAVNLFQGNVPAETAGDLPLEVVAKLSYTGVLSDRKASAKMLRDESDSRIEKLARTNTPADLPAGVPPRVAIFVARLRAVAQALQVAKNVSNFCECEHRGCRQRFFRAPGVVAASSDLGGKQTRAETQPSQDYWNLLGNRKAEAASQRRFCSPECCKQFHAELDCALPKLTGKRLDVEADPGVELSPHSRVLAGLRAAAKRNEEFARHLRTAKPRQLRACSKAVYRELAEQRVRQLNLDFLLLYASSVLAESKSLSAGLVLAGTQVRWRNRPQFVAAPAKRIEQIYDRYHRDRAVVLYNLLLSSQLLQKVKEYSLMLFR